MKILKINHGKCSMEIDVYAFFPVNQQKIKILLPMLKSVNASEISELLHTMCEYLAENAAREDTNNRCKSAARMYRANIQTIAAECGVDIPDNFTPDKSDCKPDYNYKIDVSKLPRVDSIPAPPAEFGACMVPITRRNDNGVLECYAGKGYGALIDGVPVYAQRVKAGLYIFNACGASAPVIQWHTKAAAAEGIAAALATAKRRGGKQFEEFMNNIRQFMDIPAAAPAETTPAPRKATRRAALDWIGKPMKAYPREKKPEAPKSKPKNKRRNPAEFVGKKMIITIGERAARPAAD